MPARVAEHQGLSNAEAAARLAEEGGNLVAPAHPPGVIGRVLRQLKEPLVALLLAAAVVTAVLGDVPDTIVIALVVVVNTAIGVTQEVRADASIAALNRLSAPTARVVRDGVDLIVPAGEVVRGDLVHLRTGDVVPADLTLTDAYRLQLDEAALTGESVRVARTEGEEALAGTVVVNGRGSGLAARTGAASALGRIAVLVATTRAGPTPLQRRLSSLGRILGITTVALSGIVFLAGIVTGQPVVTMAITAVSLVVAAVPESLPAVVTLALALGARRMAAQRAIPRRLHAVETLGSVTVVASDKTGTLTEGSMAVQRVVDAAGTEYHVTGHGYDPVGDVVRADGQRERVPQRHLVRLARAALLCNDATIAPPDGEARPQWTAVGDPLEAALVVLAARVGLDPLAERAAHPRVDEQPFDQATRRMTTVHQSAAGTLVVCKGAPESVLVAGLVDADTARLAAAMTSAHRLAATGLRVLALAGAVLPPGARPDPRAPRALRLLGLVGIGDPLRSTGPDIAASFTRAGIRFVLITGDHPGTAAAIGRRLGIWRDGDPITSGDRGAIDPEDADGSRLFARTQPEQKLDIVRALQERGHVVAMTGDGVNDAPALRRADIGVAMGGGTEVARQAGDLILVDDNLATVASAVREGRRIYDNIRRFLQYGLSGGFAELAVMLAGPFAGLAVPLLPAQILWVNLLTHGLPGVALGAEPAEPDVMDRPPRSPQESVFGAGLLRATLITGALMSGIVLAAGVIAQRLDRPWQTIVFLVLGLAQLGVALAVRARPAPAWRGMRGNPGLIAAIALSAALMLAGVLVPPLRTLLGTEPLTLLDVIGCAAIATLPGIGLRLIQRP